MATTPAETASTLRSINLPYTVSDSTGILDERGLARSLQEHPVVCLGENHDELLHHYVQWQLTLRAARIAKDNGAPLALGIEMLPHTLQPSLSAYETGQSGQEAFLQASDWDHTWGFDFGYYEPSLSAARAHGGHFLALNAPRTHSRAVARFGPNAVPKGPRSTPPLDLSNAPHRRFFEETLGLEPGILDATPPLSASPSSAPSDHSPPHSSSADHHGMNLGNLYAAQVLWDTTMADSVLRWLKAQPAAPTPRAIIIAGNGHCHPTAIPLRLRQMGLHDVLSVVPRTEAEARDPDAPKPAADQLVVVVQESRIGN